MSQKKSLSIVPLLSTIIFGLSGCSPLKSDVHVWCATSYEKILAESDYSLRYKDNQLFISAVKNEYEASQIVLSSNTKQKYEIRIDDLLDESGNKLSKDYINVYHEKMIALENKFDYLSPLVLGEFPDGLLPYEKAVEYNENYVKANRNQPIWINVHAPKDQKAGTYTGNFAAIVDNKEYNIPVSIKIYDYILSDECHSESSFVLRDSNILLYEQDSSDEMLEKYYDFFLDHRLSTSFPFEIIQNKYNEDMTYFIKYALKYADDGRCSLYNIPYRSVIQEVEIDENGYLAIDDKRATSPSNRRMAEINAYDWDEYLKVLNLMVKTSIASGVDLFKKATMPGTIFDEFTSDTSNGYMALNKAVYNIRRLDDIITKLSESIDYLSYTSSGVKQNKRIVFDNDNDNGGIGYYLENLIDGETYECSMDEQEFNAFKEQLKASIYDTYCYVTCTYVPSEFFFDYVPRCAICYLANLYDTKENIEKIQYYVDNKNWKAWTYTCVSPKYPYPTYHIDDELISSRLLGWQMFDYDIIGNLLWGVAIASIVSEDVNYNQLTDQDYYGTGNRYPWANGDGFLVYPGRHYGIFGPLSSVRLESILDANEDYDLFYELRESFDSEEEFNSLKQSLTENLYNGMVIKYDGDYVNNFKAKRAALCASLEINNTNKANVIKYQNNQLTLKVKNNARIQIDDKELSSYKNELGFDYYLIPLDLNNKASLSIIDVSGVSNIVL